MPGDPTRGTITPFSGTETGGERSVIVWNMRAVLVVFVALLAALAAAGLGVEDGWSWT